MPYYPLKCLKPTLKMEAAFAEDGGISAHWRIKIFNNKLQLVSKDGDEALFVPLAGDPGFALSDEEARTLRCFRVIVQYKGFTFIAYKAKLYNLHANVITECLELAKGEVNRHATLSVYEDAIFCACNEHVYRCVLNDSDWNV